MKKRIFSIATLMVVLATVIMTGCNKKESPSIKKQWIIKMISQEPEMIDISVTQSGYMIDAVQDSTLAKKANLPKDSYFIKASVQLVEINETSKNSGTIRLKFINDKGKTEEGLLRYSDLTNSTVIFYSEFYNTVPIIANAATSKITPHNITLD